jgi:hypothetical protein
LHNAREKVECDRGLAFCLNSEGEDVVKYEKQIANGWLAGFLTVTPLAHDERKYNFVETMIDEVDVLERLTTI